MGFTIILSVCLFAVAPTFAQIEMDTVTGLWLFNEGSGDAAIDSSDSGLDATIAGSPAWINAVFGSGLELDGVDAYVEVPTYTKTKLLSSVLR